MFSNSQLVFSFYNGLFKVRDSSQIMKTRTRGSDLQASVSSCKLQGDLQASVNSCILPSGKTRL